jgi:hypothetical protein
MRTYEEIMEKITQLHEEAEKIEVDTDKYDEAVKNLERKNRNLDMAKALLWVVAQIKLNL